MSPIGKEAGQWRMFKIDQYDSVRSKYIEVIRIHLMENASMSFGFVEQRVLAHADAGIREVVEYAVFCGSAKLGTDGKRDGQPVPSLRDGMNILEWLWDSREETP